MATQRKASTRKRTDPQPRDRKERPSCCDPKAKLYINTETHYIAVENKYDFKRDILLRSDALAAIKLPSGSDSDAQSGSGSQIDEVVLKNQAKVYRTDVYTVHWEVDGQCQPFHVQLDVQGEVSYDADCLPAKGEVRLSRAYLLEPPDYKPPGPGNVVARLVAEDCAGKTGQCVNRVERP